MADDLLPHVVFNYKIVKSNTSPSFFIFLNYQFSSYKNLPICTLCATTPTAMDGGGKMPESFYRVLLDRFESLEASHQKLKEQFQVVVQEKTSCAADGEEATSDSGGAARYPGWADMPGTYFAESPYRRVLEYMGHAVHVSRAGSGEISYWYIYIFYFNLEELRQWIIFLKGFSIEVVVGCLISLV